MNSARKLHACDELCAFGTSRRSDGSETAAIGSPRHAATGACRNATRPATRAVVATIPLISAHDETEDSIHGIVADSAPGEVRDGRTRAVARHGMHPTTCRGALRANGPRSHLLFVGNSLTYVN